MMERRGGGPLTASQTADMWRRWRRGETISEIARALDRYPGAIHNRLAITGGITPLAQRRSRRALTLQEREEISRGVAGGQSLRQIARTINRAPSTVSRELARNGGRTAYRAAAADQRAYRRARRPKPCRLAVNAALRNLVAEKLSVYWSPEQIAGWLKDEYPDDEQMRISHETIYKTLFIQARGALKKELQAYLRTHRKLRRSRHAKTKGQQRARIVGAISISERPPEAADRAVPGHWEGDLLWGTRTTFIATLVERHSRFTMLVKLDSRQADEVASALARKIQHLPAELCRSLTWDRGLEMAAHAQFTIATNVPVYFCDPSSPWQRGSNENTNGLLRQYFPKGKDISLHSQAELDRVAMELNQRPRKTLGFKTPAYVLYGTVASTG